MAYDFLTRPSWANSEALRHGVLLTELQTDEFRNAARQETDPQLQTAFAAVLGSLNPDLARTSEVLKALPMK